jgi:scyllo-inositol 2-dehydrogenase (NADP+)
MVLKTKNLIYMGEMIRVGLIGFGMAGKVFHAPYLCRLPGFHLGVIKTTNAEDIKIAKEKYPGLKIVKEAEEVFSMADIDLVVIATPNTSHFALAKQALLSGKHVVVDKPFTITSTEATELIQLAAQKKKIISVYHNRRWDSDFKTVKKIIESNVLGELVAYEAHFDRFRNVIKKNAWKEEDLPGSGILYDLGSHLIDQALLLFGPPDSLAADIRIQRPDGKAPDYFELTLFYQGLKVTLTAGMLVRPPAVKYIVTGLAGSFVKYGMDVQEQQLKNGAIPMADDMLGEEPDTLWGILDTNFKGLHVVGKIESEKGDYGQYYQNVRLAVLGQAPLQVTAEQAKSTIFIIELAMKSSAERRTISLKEHSV